LAHEALEFSLYHNDEVIFNLRKGSQMQRIVDIFGRKLQPLLVPIKEDLGWVKMQWFCRKTRSSKKSEANNFSLLMEDFLEAHTLAERFRKLLKDFCKAITARVFSCI
jgi:DNA mismatch repair protein MutL